MAGAQGAPSGDQEPVRTRDWIRGAVWIGVPLLIGIIGLVVLYNLVLCGCTTRGPG